MGNDVGLNYKSNVYNCDIEFLSPVYIGSGDTYGTYEAYSNKQSLITRIDVIKFYSDLDEDLQKKFLDTVVEDDFKLAVFYNSNKERIKPIKNYTRYKSYKRAEKDLNEIHEHIKTLDKLYIPGSSLKGAIETAIIYSSIDDSLIRRYISVDNKNTKSFDVKNFKRFLDSFFSSKNYPNQKANYNIMRFLKIMDSDTFNTPIIYDVKTINAQFDENNQPNGIKEAVPVVYETMDLNSFKTKSIVTKFIIDYNDKLLDGLDIQDKKEYLDINNIKSAIYKFSKDIIDYELDFAKKFDLDYLVKFYETLSDKNTPDSPVIRIGAGKGLLSSSLALKIKNIDKGAYKSIFGNFDGTEYPISKRIVVTKSKPLEGKPLGWVKLNF